MVCTHRGQLTEPLATSSAREREFDSTSREGSKGDDRRRNRGLKISEESTPACAKSLGLWESTKERLCSIAQFDQGARFNGEA